MGYTNPMLAYGVRALYGADAAAAGADGLIVPDLPPEEAGEVEAACRAARPGAGLPALAHLTRRSASRALAAQHQRLPLPGLAHRGDRRAARACRPDLAEFVARARAAAHTPLAVGFGISTPEQARRWAQLADGVIVGSALIDAVGRADQPVQAAGEFVAALRKGLEHVD